MKTTSPEVTGEITVLPNGKAHLTPAQVEELFQKRQKPATSHTPGPWILEKDEIREPKDLCKIATVNCYGTHKLHTEKAANARLIAAAPTMYNYLTLLAYSGDDKAHEIISKIAKS
jgi:hypothetical protein